VDRFSGWAAVSPVSTRRVYAGVAEVSIYCSLGKERALARFCSRLIEQSERNGIRTLQVGIFPENIASVTLHKSCGFREVGARERIGQLNGI
jgi:phosphinothricin acetyltransferase